MFGLFKGKEKEAVCASVADCIRRQIYQAIEDQGLEEIEFSAEPEKAVFFNGYLGSLMSYYSEDTGVGISWAFEAGAKSVCDKVIPDRLWTFHECGERVKQKDVEGLFDVEDVRGLGFTAGELDAENSLQSANKLYRYFMGLK